MSERRNTLNYGKNVLKQYFIKEIEFFKFKALQNNCQVCRSVYHNMSSNIDNYTLMYIRCGSGKNLCVLIDIRQLVIFSKLFSGVNIKLLKTWAGHYYEPINILLLSFMYKCVLSNHLFLSHIKIIYSLIYALIQFLTYFHIHWMGITSYGE